MQVLPCRACVHGLTKGFLESASPDLLTEVEEVEEGNEVEEDGDEEDALVPKDADEEEQSGPGDMSHLRFIVTTTLIILCSFLIAAEVDELEVGEPTIDLLLDDHSLIKIYP